MGLQGHIIQIYNAQGARFIRLYSEQPRAAVFLIKQLVCKNAGRLAVQALWV